MKNNNKNRKLKFIREKNNLRLGITKFYCVEKVHEDFVCDENYWNRLVTTAKRSLMKNWKLNLNQIKIEQGCCGDDYILDLFTNRVVLSRN